ncbi:MAG: phage holin family protein [Candidatus Kerfeldbacteria bacterium]|nr:phage holin family protein [Candidatus Kerfeldbacteria bacterium]
MLLFRLLVNALALLAIAYWLPGVRVDSFWTALIAAAIMGVLNAVIRPIFAILTLPITIVTLGLSLFIVNIVVFSAVASLLPGFTVESFQATVIGALVLWAVGFVSGTALK